MEVRHGADENVGKYVGLNQIQQRFCIFSFTGTNSMAHDDAEWVDVYVCETETTSEIECATVFVCCFIVKRAAARAFCELFHKCNLHIAKAGSEPSLNTVGVKFWHGRFKF